MQKSVKSFGGVAVFAKTDWDSIKIFPARL
jgi:hypothetical protein